MTNLEALKAQCRLICNTCYVDDDVARLTLLSTGLNPDDEVIEINSMIVQPAITIVKGWIETSRSENGFAVSIDLASIQKNIQYWCGKTGLDASEFVDVITVDSGSNLW